MMPLLITFIIFLLFYYSSMIDSFSSFSYQSSFECGFFSNFFSRISFSIHYIIIALLFVLLDLEFTMIFWFFFSSTNSFFFFFFFIYFSYNCFVGFGLWMIGWKLGMVILGSQKGIILHLIFLYYYGLSEPFCVRLRTELFM